MFAKTPSDANLRFIFASGGGPSIPFLMDDSSKLRGDMLEVGDLSDQDAVDYLIRRGVPKDRAADAVANIIGGRLIELNNYANYYKEYATNADYHRPLDIDTNTIIGSTESFNQTSNPRSRTCSE